MRFMVMLLSFMSIYKVIGSDHLHDNALVFVRSHSYRLNKLLALTHVGESPFYMMNYMLNKNFLTGLRKDLID